MRYKLDFDGMGGEQGRGKERADGKRRAAQDVLQASTPPGCGTARAIRFVGLGPRNASCASDVPGLLQSSRDHRGEAMWIALGVT